MNRYLLTRLVALTISAQYSSGSRIQHGGDKSVCAEHVRQLARWSLSETI